MRQPIGSFPQFVRAGLIAALSLSVLPAALQASAGTQGAAFLDIPVGATPASLGSAYTALAADAYASVWNPAGLGFVRTSELAGQHVSYLESMNYEYAGLALPLGGNQGSRGALGFSAQYLGSGDIRGRDETGKDTGQFSSRYGAYSLAYGRTVTDRLSLGLTGKWINARLADFSANAYGLDVGGLYRYSDRLALALTAANFGSKLNFINEGDSLPTAFHAGVAFRPARPLLATTEGVFGTDGRASGRVGLEWRPLESVRLRAGYRSDTLKELSALAGFSTGIGLEFWGQEFSYAWVPYGDLGDTQYFSVLLKWGGADQNHRNLVDTRTIRTHRDARVGRSGFDPDYEQLMQLLDGPARPSLAFESNESPHE